MNQNLSYEDYLKGTRDVLDESRKEASPYLTSVAGKEFVVRPNVFSPKYFHDTEEFASHLPDVAGDELLEIGPGTGAISIIAALQGAKRVVAVDINPEAVKNTQENIEKHNLSDKVEVREGDLYDPIKDDEKFDLIFWNTPFGLIDKDDIDNLEKAVFDPGYKSTERFIKEAKSHLKKDGKLLIGFSTTLGKFELLQKFIQGSGFSLEKIFEVESNETHPVKFEMFLANQN